MSSKGLPAIRNISTVAVIFGIVLLCFIWGGLYYKVQGERQLEIDNAIDDTSHYARTFEEHTVRTIRGLDQVMLFLKYQAEKEELGIDIARLVGEKRFDGQPFILMTVINEAGDIVANSLSGFASINVSDREYFQVHKNVENGRLYIGKPILGRYLSTAKSGE